MKTVILVRQKGLGSAGSDEEFGILMFDRFIHALETTPQRPDALCFYTEGVRLVCEGSQALLGLQLLAGHGVRMIACRSCLERYGLVEKIAVGEIGTMNEIADLLLTAEKVITV